MASCLTYSPVFDDRPVLSRAAMVVVGMGVGGRAGGKTKAEGMGAAAAAASVERLCGEVYDQVQVSDLRGGK